MPATLARSTPKVQRKAGSYRLTIGRTAIRKIDPRSGFTLRDQSNLDQPGVPAIQHRRVKIAAHQGLSYHDAGYTRSAGFHDCFQPPIVMRGKTDHRLVSQSTDRFFLRIRKRRCGPLRWALA